MADENDRNLLALGREIEQIQREGWTAKLELSWKDGRLVAATYKERPFLK